MGVLKSPFVCVNGRCGGGRAKAVWVRGITPESSRAVEGGRGLENTKSEQGHTQYEGGGQESRIVFRKRKPGIQAPMSFVFRFPASVFLGYFITLLCPSFSTAPCPSAPSRANTIVKESFSHVTARGVHLA